jgi:starch-binding outer membrane protein, SusD/RagB family
MKNLSNLIMKRSTVLLLVLLLFSCNLDVQIKSGSGGAIIPPAPGSAPTPESIGALYGQINGLATDQGDWFGIEEHTTDFMMGPTRGTDWDDFGTWRKLHLHTWDGTHNQVNTDWNNIQQGLFQTTLLAESPTASAPDAAAAKFLRSFWAYYSLNHFGVLQHRPATAAVQDLPSVYNRKDGTENTITELEGAIANLPSWSSNIRNVATKEAAYFLAARLYLNKAVFENDPSKPAGPFTFDPADMNKVISYVDMITASGNFQINSNYWDNFTWNNSTTSTENIWVRHQSDGINVVWQSCMGGHYNMVPSGWNGFVVLSDFYNMYDTLNDTRAYAQITDGNYNTLVGRNAGFLTGQQYGPTQGTNHAVGQPILPLTDRSGSPLIFTKEASLYLSTESRGYRTNKYPLDPSTINGGGWSSTNDYVFFRYADALLMKAEAILRGGTATNGDTPLSLVNSIRANRGVSPLSTVDLPTLLQERGRELYLEAVRRTDMIRFGVFNDPVVERPVASDPTRCILPIPNLALSSNPNLKQNPGY